VVQLRHDYPEFRRLNSEVLVVVPNGPRTIGQFRKLNKIPFPILSDKGSKVAAQYGIETNHIIGVNVMTASAFLVNASGVIRHAQYLDSYFQEPDNLSPLAILKDHLPGSG
jgi:peroxiredoxin